MMEKEKEKGKEGGLYNAKSQPREFSRVKEETHLIEKGMCMQRSVIS